MSLMIQGVNVYLTECGAGSPVLFLHGAPDAAELWSGVIEHLRGHYHCVAADLPDFGATYGLSWAVTHPHKVQRLTIVGGSNFSSRYRWHGTARLFRMPLLGELSMATLTLP